MNESAAQALLATNERNRTSHIYLYFASLTLLVSLGTGGSLLTIVVSFLLKDQLHASPSQVAAFGFLVALPIYFSAVFGLIRDLWSPFGLRDRGYFLLFAPIAAAVFAVMAYSGLTYAGLFGGLVLAIMAFRFISAAYSGLMALVGQEKFMTGRLAALLNIVGYVPGIAGALASGWFVEHVSPRDTFLAMAAFTLAIALVGLWKPREVFERAYDQPLAQGADLWRDVKRLLGHRPIYPAILVTFLFQFMPGVGVPLMYYLTNRLHAPATVYGYYGAIYSAAYVPVFFLYGWLCQRVSLNKLLWWGTIITIPQMVPLAFIHSGNQALVMAVPIGLMGGIACAAYTDLTIRSCPPGLQGTLMTMVAGFYALSTEGGNVLGAALYSASPKHGFLYDIIATMLVYAAILPILKLIPKDLIATADGQLNTAVQAKALE